MKNIINFVESHGHKATETPYQVIIHIIDNMGDTHDYYVNTMLEARIVLGY